MVAEGEVDGIPAPEAWRGVLFARHWLAGTAPSNVWLGTTVEDYRVADRWGDLAQIAAVVRFLSVEPMIGPLDIEAELLCPSGCGRKADVVSLVHEDGTPYSGEAHERDDDVHEECGTCGEDGEWLGPDWVICGGESGRHARPMNPEWVRSLRRDCNRLQIPFFFKQWGAWAPCELDVEDDTYDEDIHAWSEPYVPAWSVDGLAFYKASVRIGKKTSGRILDGRTWDEYPTPGNYETIRSRA